MVGPEPYSSKTRTALVLTGTGTAGAYHAGVLKALGEAGVRIDLVAGHGIGVVGACFAAIDGAESLWKADGFWQQARVRQFYSWRRVLRVLGWLGGAVAGLLAVPLCLLALGLVVFPIAFLLRLVRLEASNAWADGYAWLVHEAFLPDRLPSWLAEIVLVLAIIGVGVVAVASARGRLRGRHREEGRFWWRVFGAPVASREAIDHWRLALWRLISGGAKVPQPDPVQLSRRYSELLSDNVGQPGFKEVIAIVHDLDARRDLVAAVLTEPYRASFFGRRRRTAAWAARANETLDLAGADRDHVVDVLAAALSLPVVTPPWPVTFAADSYWSGETHRLCDRPDATIRLLEEVVAAGVDQVIIVSATPAPGEPHALTDPRVDGHGRLGQWLLSRDTAGLRDASSARADQFKNLHIIRPDHNPVGPLDFGGAYDGRSDRMATLAELVDLGYADAYRQFVEPVVGAADVTP
ncbi:MAG: patatin-like phospholipase family protein [Acidobacteria bacterium]|nr:patatin-like phospholipase family protein [Acidobacteriota bacterium]